MGKQGNRGLPFVRLLMVVSSLAPLFLLWAVRGAPPVPDSYWISICVGLAVIPNLVLLWRWRTAKHRKDHRSVIIGEARDQSDRLLVYLFAMLLPLYTATLASERELVSVAMAFIFIVFLFWHMNLHYINIVFAVLGYRVYTVLMPTRPGLAGTAVVLLSKRNSPPPAGELIDGLRLSDTVFVEKEADDAERV
jgi:hypothetical protein